MREIAVVGTGNLGQRHVEGIAKSSFVETIHIVDPVAENREKAAAFIKNIEIKVSLHETVVSLPKKLDLAIIATNANDRLSLVKAILNRRVISNLILEKLVFNKTEEFRILDDYTRDLSVNILVNFPRRMVKFYQHMKFILKDEKNITFNVYGGNWGLASNLVHFLDVFQYITNAQQNVKTSIFDISPISSKREGYVEFLGEIEFEFKNATFNAKSDPLESSKHFIEIKSKNIQIFIDEVDQYAIVTSGNTEEQMDLKIPYQSYLSKVFVDQLFNTKKCDLPSYREASLTHLIYLQELEKYAEEKNLMRITDIT